MTRICIGLFGVLVALSGCSKDVQKTAPQSKGQEQDGDEQAAPRQALSAGWKRQSAGPELLHHLLRQRRA